MIWIHWLNLHISSYVFFCTYIFMIPGNKRVKSGSHSCQAKIPGFLYIVTKYPSYRQVVYGRTIVDMDSRAGSIRFSSI